MIAYRCRHSGMYVPEDWVKDWGRHPGTHGLGPTPISPCHDSQEYQPKAEDFAKELMHPTGLAHAELDWVDITPEEFESKKLILPNEDNGNMRVVTLMKAKQKNKRRAQTTALLLKLNTQEEEQ